MHQMPADARPLPKEERQRLIESVIGRRRVGTQLELRNALAGAGCAVTQATLSRDLRELGVEKLHDDLGRARYVLPGGAGPIPPRRSRRSWSSSAAVSRRRRTSS